MQDEMKRRIAFLHTSKAHVATFDGLLADLDVTLHHSVEPSWLERARRAGIDLVLLKEVRAHLEALAADADLVICTCTTLGPIAESMNDARIHRLDAPVRLPSKGCAWLLFFWVLVGLGVVVLFSS